MRCQSAQLLGLGGDLAQTGSLRGGLLEALTRFYACGALLLETLGLHASVLLQLTQLGLYGLSCVGLVRASALLRSELFS